MMIKLIINRCIRNLWNFIKQFFYPTQTLHFDNGPIITIHQKIAEGGFSYIYSATDSIQRKYALKRIMCNDEDMIDACRREVDVHRQVRGDHVLHLFNVKYVSSPQRMCYMLFPLITGGSLRDEVNQRRLLSDDLNQVRALRENQVLTIFKGVLKGVKALHDAGYAHYDVKLENVMMDRQAVGAGINFGDEEMNFAMNPLRDPGVPILMDFGSARKLVVKLDDRRTVLNLTELASQNSTISYRAPELFDGGCRHGPLETDIDGKVDIWSCGCLLFGLMYGASPFEIEFRRSGSVRIVDCTHLRVLGGKIPYPPASREVAHKYSHKIHELVDWILTVDRKERPTIEDVLSRVEGMLTRQSSGLRDLV